MTKIDGNSGDTQKVTVFRDETHLRVKLKETEVVIEVRYFYRDYIVADIMETLSNLHMDAFSVRSHTANGFLTLNLKAKVNSDKHSSSRCLEKTNFDLLDSQRFRGDGVASVGMNKRELRRVIEGEVTTICSKAKNPSFCSNFFKSTPQTKTLNLPGVAKFLINDASREALDTQKQFESLVKGAADPRSKDIYTQCSENYKNALNEFNAALQALADMDGGSLNIKVSAAMTEGDSCNSELPRVKTSPQLLKKIYDIDNLSGIVLVISNILPKK
ncbi:unnamed protein product [Microthlaspi erraticum]|uniref:Pectinesterase inhibitor domain-containing protein n=1 Tax=Microthlaspi erraticum TaxID=1685480 RepID=A0A6D2K4I3_9BRAS|nr:unnamed protein product [Microthlaspi erraticum]